MTSPIDGRMHVHHCPECFETKPCDRECDLEPDLGHDKLGRPYASHVECDDCEAKRTKVETFDDQLARVGMMANGNAKWDLSDHDVSALKAVLDALTRSEHERDEARAALQAIADRGCSFGFEYLCSRNRDEDTCGACRAHTAISATKEPKR